MNDSNAARYLKDILWGILPRPEALRIQQETAADVTVLTILLPQEDRCFVVGKGGRNIEAVRHLLRAFAGRHGQMVVAKLPDERKPTEVQNDEQQHYDGN